MGRYESDLNTIDAKQVSVDRFCFLLLPGFSALDLSAGLDVLSAANQAGAQPCFTWKIVSETGAAVVSSSGMKVAVEDTLAPLQHGDCIVVCAPMHVLDASTELKAWLRRNARFGVHLIGLGGAAALFANIGLADGQRLSTHWKLQPALAELFPGIDVVCSVYEQDRGVSTCGGGAASLDFFAALVGRKCGEDIALSVADQLLSTSFRTKGDRQTRSDLCRLGKRNEKLGLAIQIMQDSLEEPPSPAQIAAEIGLSTRQLERLFQRHIGSSPKTYMTALRLDRARLLLLQTQLRVIDVAVACGFSSASHFSKLYRKQFGISPHLERGVV